MPARILYTEGSRDGTVGGSHVSLTGFQENPADFINIMDAVVHASIEPEPFGRVNIELSHPERLYCQ